MNMWSALLLPQELSACLSEFILAKPLAIRKYCGWSPFLAASHRTARKTLIASLPPSLHVTRLLSSPCPYCGRLASQLLVREIEKLKTMSLRPFFLAAKVLDSR